MPWTEKQERYFRAVEHGWKPSKGKKKLSPQKAKELLDEAKSVEDKAQKKALREHLK